MANLRNIIITGCLLCDYRHILLPLLLQHYIVVLVSSSSSSTTMLAILLGLAVSSQEVVVVVVVVGAATHERAVKGNETPLHSNNLILCMIRWWTENETRSMIVKMCGWQLSSSSSSSSRRLGKSYPPPPPPPTSTMRSEETLSESEYMFRETCIKEPKWHRNDLIRSCGDLSTHHPPHPLYPKLLIQFWR